MYSLLLLPSKMPYKLSIWKMNAVSFVTIVKFLNNLYIILKFKSLCIYLFILPIDYFIHFIDLFSSEM